MTEPWLVTDCHIWNLKLQKEKEKQPSIKLFKTGEARYSKLQLRYCTFPSTDLNTSWLNVSRPIKLVSMCCCAKITTHCVPLIAPYTEVADRTPLEVVKESAYMCVCVCGGGGWGRNEGGGGGLVNQMAGTAWSGIKLLSIWKRYQRPNLVTLARYCSYRLMQIPMQKNINSCSHDSSVSRPSFSSVLETVMVSSERSFVVDALDALG